MLFELTDELYTDCACYLTEHFDGVHITEPHNHDGICLGCLMNAECKRVLYHDPRAPGIIYR